MAYDNATVQMLRNVLDEVLASSRFIGQKQRSALEIAERILWLASQGEREAATIKLHLLDEFLASGSYSVRAEKPISMTSKAPRWSSDMRHRGS
ncbi:hypothetical protein [Bradyrhizobium sp. Cp5.3]|uniref:hypothetical protein n=1 Tax=Bradyrhizobium sp. Cp5.3 TaxID=443598 RepID=UPI00048292CC|nr:hypothetical protein [Bradyrhizobium sp. Cp5.3]